MRTFIGFVLHTFGIQHRQCDIISGVYHKRVTFICAVCRQQLRCDVTVRLVTAFEIARLDYCNVILVCCYTTDLSALSTVSATAADASL